VAVLGEMRELGDLSAEEHARAGALAAEVGVTLLVVVGDGARQLAAGGRAAGVPEVLEVEDAPEALRALQGRLGPGDMVLVKASRAVGLESVADAIAAGHSGDGTRA
jgi:UDP-N-acetylmuramoyl-tripeptide--D-alanyl-D-alanine ligase